LSEFDWRLIRTKSGTPLIRIAPGFVPVPGAIGGMLFPMGFGMYAMTNTDVDNGIVDPQILAFLWARSDSMAKRIYDRELTVEKGHERIWSPPPVEVLGFDDFTFLGALRFEQGRKSNPRHNASYRFPTGEFYKSEIASKNGAYYFLSLNPEPDEVPIGVQFRLF
jgi:hypothetical protein